MKRFVLFILLLCCVFAVGIHGAETAEEVILQINNPMMQVGQEKAEIDPGRSTVPLIQNGRTLVPIRAIIEAFGGTAEWEAQTQTVILAYGSDQIRLVIQSEVAYINNTAYTLEVAPQIIDGRTMLPIRFVAEGFRLNVAWLPEHACIAITKGKPASDVHIPEAWKAETSLKVHFIDVGQGDSVFIELPNKETMLIDAGPREDIVDQYIKNLGYTHLHYVIATHPDSDHIGGMAQILQSFSVGAFYMPNKEHTTKMFENMLDAVAANGCAAFYAEAGKHVFKTNTLSAVFVSPTKPYSDNNNASAVLWLAYKNNSFLFTGDAEATAEQDILTSGAFVDADVLKVGHHGSQSSTTEAFLTSVSPRYAVICVGEDNKYGHPEDSVLALLTAHRAKVYRTDQSGTLVFICNGTDYSVQETQIGAISATQTEETVDRIVYITNTGTKYHKAGCSYLKSAVETTEAAAKSMGLSPCKRCFSTQ